MAGDRGVSHTQLLCRTRQAARTRDSNKRSDKVPVEIKSTTLWLGHASSLNKPAIRFLRYLYSRFLSYTLL